MLAMIKNSLGRNEPRKHQRILNVTAFRETSIEPELLGEISDGYLVQTG